MKKESFAKKQKSEKYILEGNTHLRGKVSISGSKNAALPIIAATVMTPAVFVLKNIPEIRDVEHMLEIIEGIGASVKKIRKNVYEVDTRGVNSYVPNFKLVRNIRASILLIGSLLARFGKAKIAQPGGCFIGSRPLLTHFKSLRDMGVRIIRRGEYYSIAWVRPKEKNSIILREMSVTATAIILMMAAKTKTTEIRLAAAEPHIEDFCKFLNKLGIRIAGCGSHEITVFGKKNLAKRIEHTIVPDQIEAGTFAIAAAASRGNVEISNFVPEHHDILLSKFHEIGVNFRFVGKNKLLIKPTTIFRPADIRTDVYPGFPTDLQAPMAVLLTQAEGTSEIHETLFEVRLNYLKELKRMGAEITIKDPHHAIITGPTPLYGTIITSFDLRAGATLIIAGLIAQGQSVIRDIHLIDRGYENIEEKLEKLGARIGRIDTI